MNQVTSCCKAGTIQRQVKEYPDGITFYTLNTYDACEACGEEIEDILDTCDCCGEVSEKFIEVKLGDWCEKCVRLYAEDLMERVTDDAVRTVTA